MTLSARTHQNIRLKKTDGTFLTVYTCGIVATVDSGLKPQVVGEKDGVPVVVESPAEKVDGWPSEDDTGHIIVSAQAALAARELGLRTKATIYSPGPVSKQPDGEMAADFLRRWPDWPSAE